MKSPVSGGPCINSRRPRARLRRSGHRAYSLCRCLRGAGGGIGRHRGLPVFGIASRSPFRVDRIARRRLPCAKRASLLLYAPRHQIEPIHQQVYRHYARSSNCAALSRLPKKTWSGNGPSLHGDVRGSVSGEEGGTPTVAAKHTTEHPPCHSELRRSRVYRWHLKS